MIKVAQQHLLTVGDLKCDMCPLLFKNFAEITVLHTKKVEVYFCEKRNFLECHEWLKFNPKLFEF